MADVTRSLAPGEIIRDGKAVLATCATCHYFDAGLCLANPPHPLGDMKQYSYMFPEVSCNNWCSLHPLRDPQVAIAEQQKRIADALERIAVSLKAELPR